jgi:hypothetical protein
MTSCLLACAMAWQTLAAAAAPTGVENQFLRVGVDAAGNMAALTHLRSGWNYADSP